MRRDLAERYGTLEEWHWWFEGRRQIVGRVLRKVARASPTRQVISLGSGPASGICWLAPLAGPTGWVIGLDADPSGALADGRDTGGSREPRVRLVIGRAETPPLRTKSWDVVLAMDLLEHLDDDASGLRAMAGLVRPGGTLLVTVPALPSLWGNQDIVSHHRRRYTRTSLREAFARAGLPPPRVTYFNSFLFPIVAAVRWTRRLTGRTLGTRSDFDDSRPGLVNDLLARIFSAERHLLGRIDLPVGVSLLAHCRIQ